MEQEKKYSLIVESAINILKAFILIGFFIIAIIVIINIKLNLNKIWNISFLSTMFLLYFSSIIQLIINFFGIGKYNKENIDRKSKIKSNIIFSSCITYLVFLAIFILYISLSIIFFI